jgi:hypothetical protein
MCQFCPKKFWLFINKFPLGNYKNITTKKIMHKNKNLQVREWLNQDVFVCKRHHKVNVLWLATFTIFHIIKQWIKIFAHSACASVEIYAHYKKYWIELLHFWMETYRIHMTIMCMRYIPLKKNSKIQSLGMFALVKNVCFLKTK